MQTNGCFCVWKRSLVCSVPSAGSSVLFWFYDPPAEEQQHILKALKIRFLLEKKYIQIISWIFSWFMFEIQSNVLFNWFETQTKSFQVEKWNSQAWQTYICYHFHFFNDKKKCFFLSKKCNFVDNVIYGEKSKSFPLKNPRVLSYIEPCLKKKTKKTPQDKPRFIF